MSVGSLREFPKKLFNGPFTMQWFISVVLLTYYIATTFHIGYLTHLVGWYEATEGEIPQAVWVVSAFVAVWIAAYAPKVVPAIGVRLMTLTRLYTNDSAVVARAAGSIYIAAIALLLLVTPFALGRAIADANTTYDLVSLDAEQAKAVGVDEGVVILWQDHRTLVTMMPYDHSRNAFYKNVRMFANVKSESVHLSPTNLGHDVSLIELRGPNDAGLPSASASDAPSLAPSNVPTTDPATSSSSEPSIAP